MEVKYEDQEFAIHFPNFKWVRGNCFGKKPILTLEGTEIGINWNLDPLDDFYCWSWSPSEDTFGFVSGCLIVRSLECLSEAEALNLQKLLNGWKGGFVDWLKLVSFGNGCDDLPVPTRRDVDSGYLLGVGDEFKRLEVIHTIHATAVLRSDDAIGIQDIVKAANLNYKKIDVPLHYVYLMDALKNFRQDDFRHCVLDTATAYELALMALKDLYYQKYNVSDDIKKLIDQKYDGIKQLSDLEALNFAKDFVYTFLPISEL